MNNEIKSFRGCPVCGLKKTRVVHAMRFELPETSTLPRQYEVVACQSCGMVYADSTATQKDYDFYYEQFSKYEDVKTASGGGYLADDQKRLNDMAALISSHLQVSDSIVDIGCANGGLLDELSKLGYHKLVGIDPSATSVSHIRKRGFVGFALKISELKSAEVGVHQAVVLSHVLEHVFDLSATMEIMRSLLDDCGLLYIEVPDASRYQSHYVVPFYYFDSEHINHFDLSALRNLAGQYGFEIVAEGQKEIPVSLTVNYPATYILLRKHSHAVGSEILYSYENESNVRAYVQMSKDDKRLLKIDQYEASQEPIILWGAGSYTQRLLATTKLAGCNIVSIVDSDRKKHGLEIGAIKVESTDVLRQTKGVILISAAIYAEEIIRDIAMMGLKHKVDVIG